MTDLQRLSRNGTKPWNHNSINKGPPHLWGGRMKLTSCQFPLSHPHCLPDRVGPSAAWLQKSVIESAESDTSSLYPGLKSKIWLAMAFETSNVFWYGSGPLSAGLCQVIPLFFAIYRSPYNISLLWLDINLAKKNTKRQTSKTNIRLSVPCRGVS